MSSKVLVKEDATPTMKKTESFITLLFQTFFICATIGVLAQHMIGNETEGVNKYKIFKLVLTGGPCGGKSSVLKVLVPKLREIYQDGVNVYSIQEMATTLFMSGVNMRNSSDVGQFLQFEMSRIRLQMTYEDEVVKIAKSAKKPAIMICDRGLLDGLAYLEYELRDHVLDYNLEKSRNERYNAVFHLVTTALGAEDYYTLEGNEARNETIEEARLKDYQVRELWQEHHNYHIIESKIGKTINDKVNEIIKKLIKMFPPSTIRS